MNTDEHNNQPKQEEYLTENNVLSKKAYGFETKIVLIFYLIKSGDINIKQMEN